jgi:hypothetical protein
MKLEKKQIEAWEVDYNDWDEFVNDYFDFEPDVRPHGCTVYPYEFIADVEANNYSAYEFHPDGKISKSSLKSVEKWMKDPKSGFFMTHGIFNYIVSKGDLPKGTYYIKVSW